MTDIGNNNIEDVVWVRVDTLKTLVSSKVHVGINLVLPSSDTSKGFYDTENFCVNINREFYHYLLYLENDA